MEEVKKEPLKEAEETEDLEKPEESSSEAAPVGIKESEKFTGSEDSSVKDDSKDVSEDSKDVSEDSKDVSEDSEDSEESATEVQNAEESEGSTEPSLEAVSQGIKEPKVSSEESKEPVGITDEELSRVFAAIPRKSKVALDRVESKMNSVKGSKSSPSWYPWVFSLIMIIGLIWAVAYYLTGNYPIPHIGAWNLVIAFVTILVGFAMTMAWK